MKDTLGEKGLLPSRPIFVVITRFSTLSNDLPSLVEREKAIVSLHAEMNSGFTERRVREALTKHFPLAADHDY